MTKLIALIALLAALAWGVTATASWISKRKAPRALGPGSTPRPVTSAEVDRAMVVAQLRTAAGAAFAMLMFGSLFRVSVGLSGQAGLTAVLTAGLSASGGLLLFSALPAKKLPSTTALADPQKAPPLLPKLALVLPAAILLAFAAFITSAGIAGPDLLAWHNGVPALLAALAIAGSALLALHRLKTAASLPDPRMAALDKKWRACSARDLTTFASGALLASLGGTALAASAAATSSPLWTTACLAGGAALAVAGVMLLVLAAKGALTLRTRVKANTPVPAAAG